MSHHSFFCARALPHSETFPNMDSDPAEVIISGQSRSYYFQSKVRLLLNRTEKHEALRFISAESCTHESRDGIDRNVWTLIEARFLEEPLHQIEDLLTYCGSNVAELPRVMLIDDQGWSTDYIHECVANAIRTHEVPEDVPDGDEGDSPKFVFTALTAIGALLRTAQKRGFDVEFYTWVGDIV